MTCIVGYVDDDHIWMGGDSAGVGGYDLRKRKDEKVFTIETKKAGAFIFGFTSSFRMGQLIRYSFDPPEFIDGSDVFKYMVVNFVDYLRNCYDKGGYLKKKDNVDRGGTFLVGYKDRLFEIEDDFQVCEVEQNYNSVGCGSSYALGSLYANITNDIETKIRIALGAASEFSAGVSPPFIIKKIKIER